MPVGVINNEFRISGDFSQWVGAEVFQGIMSGGSRWIYYWIIWVIDTNNAESKQGTSKQGPATHRLIMSSSGMSRRWIEASTTQANMVFN